MDSKQVYEIGFHILPTVAEEKLGDEVSVLRNAIEQGGAVILEDFPKMRDLAYKMQKYIDTKKVSFTKAYFGWIKFEGESELAQELKKVADEHENILRYLIIKTIRENTLLTKPKERVEREEPSSEKTAEEKSKMSAKEIDESIDELVIE